MLLRLLVFRGNYDAGEVSFGVDPNGAKLFRLAR